jgi:large subunit ribosomal protein L17
MRHKKHKFQLGVKKEHRESMLAGLAAALFRHERIQTTLTKAKALRPFAEKLVTLSCKAMRSEDAARKLHYRRLAVARMRDHAAVKKLFDEQAEEFLARAGGYTRIYKLVPRQGDAAKMALIEIVKADDKGFRKGGRRHRPTIKSTERLAVKPRLTSASENVVNA